ncbi:MAG: XisI protein [Coleofasciculaceae cyanobacterium SM2_1_6]|nr:XisI protein [Coleofasciculaceae cyanobacterium SM2_1_6]
MTKSSNYRQIIKKLLTGYYEMAVQGSINLNKIELDKLETDERLAFDEERDQYLWFCSGWEGKNRVRHINMYLQIKDSKIWVEEDNTDLWVVDDLLAAGIPKQDIVLGFHHPSKRAFTEFAPV